MGVLVITYSETLVTVMCNAASLSSTYNEYVYQARWLQRHYFILSRKANYMQVWNLDHWEEGYCIHMGNTRLADCR